MYNDRMDSGAIMYIYNPYDSSSYYTFATITTSLYYGSKSTSTLG